MPAGAPGASLTPAMRQYFEAKRQYRHAILFFRMGDFYEMFYEDALVAARALDLTLTSRSKDASGAAVPMCGVPYHAADGYIARLVKKGYRVAICEQVEDPKKAKGVVRREVVRVVSPGTLADSSYLDAREPAFLMAISQTSGTRERPAEYGVALLDLSTGEFDVAEYAGSGGLQALEDEIAVLRPREVVVAGGYDARAAIPAIGRLDLPVTEVDGWHFEIDSARQTLVEQLRVASLDGYGLERHQAAIAAAGALVRHLRDTQKAELAHVRTIRLKHAAETLVIDPTTLRHLEVVEAAAGGRAGSLLHEIDRTVTATGGRLLRAWLLRPLVVLERIRDRLDAVEEFAMRATERAKVREAFKAVQDLERLVSRIALATAGPRDLTGLGASLAVVPRLSLLLDGCRRRSSAACAANSTTASPTCAVDRLDPRRRAAGAGPDGGVIATASSGSRRAAPRQRSGQQVIAEMEERERAHRHRLAEGPLQPCLGYYIEVSKASLHAVPDDYAQADGGQGRALHHAGAQSRGEGARRR